MLRQEQNRTEQNVLGRKLYSFQYINCYNIYEPGHEKLCLMSYANNKGADQPAHPRSLISAFVVRCLDSIISLDSRPVCVWPGRKLPKTRFVVSRLIYM